MCFIFSNHIVSAWDAASEAVQRYGSFVSALDGVNSHTNLGSSSGGSSSSGKTSGSVGAITDAMRQNSLKWLTATDSERKSIDKSQLTLADQYRKISGDNIYRQNGSWYHENGSLLYSLNEAEIAHEIVSKMKQNSALWNVADVSTQKSLSEQNNTLASRLAEYLGVKITRDSDGVWWIGGRKLYDVYHSGGIVGKTPSLKQNEVMAVLEKGEAVLDEPKERGLYKIVDFVSVLSDKLGKVIDENNIGRLFGIARTSGFPLAIGDHIKESMEQLTAVAANRNSGSECKIERIEVTAPIQVVQKLDSDELKRHADTIGALSAQYIKDGFTKQGIRKAASLF